MILVHGGGGDRTGSMAHAKLLARHGYGVLLHDSRGRRERGELKWRRLGLDKDAAGALTFLGQRQDVDPDPIGALGLSTGANVLLEVAAERKDLRAVVADGAGMRSCDDFLALGGRAVWLGAPVFCTMFAAQRVFSARRPASRSGNSSRASAQHRFYSSPAAADGSNATCHRIRSRAPVRLWVAGEGRYVAARDRDPCERRG